MSELSASYPERPAAVRTIKSLRVELGLAALACVLAVTLGLFPFRGERDQSPPGSTAAVSSKANAAVPRPVKSKKANSQRAKPATVKRARISASPRAPAPKRAAPRPATADVSARSTKVKAAKSKNKQTPEVVSQSNKKDKYDALKNAWGN